MFFFFRGYPAHLSEEIISEAENPGTDSEHYDEQSVVVQLAASVQDGTRCRSGSLDMCIKGKCQVRKGNFQGCTFFPSWI